MTEALADDYGRSTEKLAALYERWSKGGAGLLITGNIQVDRRYIERPGNVCIDGEQDEESLAALRALAKAGQRHGSRIYVQLGHAGRQSNGMVNMEPVGPGDVRIGMPKASFGTPRPLTRDEIGDVRDRFVHAAKVCQACGFDGIQLHGAHGYLLSSFLNPLANNRKDDYGGYRDTGPSLCHFGVWCHGSLMRVAWHEQVRSKTARGCCWTSCERCVGQWARRSPSPSSSTRQTSRHVGDAE